MYGSTLVPMPVSFRHGYGVSYDASEAAKWFRSDTTRSRANMRDLKRMAHKADRLRQKQVAREALNEFFEDTTAEQDMAALRNEAMYEVLAEEWDEVDIVSERLACWDGQRWHDPEKYGADDYDFEYDYYRDTEPYESDDSVGDQIAELERLWLID